VKTIQAKTTKIILKWAIYLFFAFITIYSFDHVAHNPIFNHYNISLLILWAISFVAILAQTLALDKNLKVQ
jgi:hypothetical protein